MRASGATSGSREPVTFGHAYSREPIRPPEEAFGGTVSPVGCHASAPSGGEWAKEQASRATALLAACPEFAQLSLAQQRALRKAVAHPVYSCAVLEALAEGAARE